MVVLIVLIVMIAIVMKARYVHGARRPQGDDAETLRMKEELKMLRDRIAVLERIATDRENSLSRQIEELRDR
jgi:uncharacterized membrane protein